MKSKSEFRSPGSPGHSHVAQAFLPAVSQAFQPANRTKHAVRTHWVGLPTGTSTLLQAGTPALPAPQFEPLRTSDFGLRTSEAFTLIEMLVVIAIIGILAAIAVPTLNAFKPNATAAATQQLLADIGRARQLAMSERTTVYMVFVPTNFWNDAAFNSLPIEERKKADRLLDKQYIGYNYIALRSLGDQPGSPTPRYLSAWRSLPEGTFISLFKFNARNTAHWITNWSKSEAFQVLGFQVTNNIPFPSESAIAGGRTQFAPLPYLAFNYLGQLESDRDEIIPISRGSVTFGRDTARKATQRLPTFIENPAGNSTNSAFNLIVIDKLTGRPHVERQEVQ